MPSRDAAPLHRAWRGVTDTLQIAPPLSGVVWRAVVRSTHPHAMALKYHLAQMQERPTAARAHAAFDQGGALAARRLVLLLDVLVDEQRLDQRTASQFQDVVLRWMDNQGQWR